MNIIQSPNDVKRIIEVDNLEFDVLEKILAEMRTLARSKRHCMLTVRTDGADWFIYASNLTLKVKSEINIPLRLTTEATVPA